MTHPIGNRVACIVWPSAFANIALGLMLSILIAASLFGAIAWKDWREH